MKLDSFIINQQNSYKNKQFKFLLFGIVKHETEGDEINEKIIISPFQHLIAESDFALILWNMENMLYELESISFYRDIDQIKQKYFQGTIQSSNKEFDRKTMNNLNFKFMTKKKPLMSINEDRGSSISRESLLSSIFDDSLESQTDLSDNKRWNSVILQVQRLCLNRDHPDFIQSIKNK